MRIRVRLSYTSLSPNQGFSFLSRNYFFKIHKTCLRSFYVTIIPNVIAFTVRRVHVATCAILLSSNHHVSFLLYFGAHGSCVRMRVGSNQWAVGGDEEHLLKLNRLRKLFMFTARWPPHGLPLTPISLFSSAPPPPFRGIGSQSYLHFRISAFGCHVFIF